MDQDAAGKDWRIVIEPGGLEAFVRAGAGANFADADEMCITALVHEANILLNADVKNAIMECAALMRVHVQRGNEAFAFLIAKGVEPMEGVDGRVEFVGELDPRQRRAKVSGEAKGSKTDHYTKELFTIVNPGDRIAVIHEPTPGVDGRDVCGKTLAAREPKRAGLGFDDTFVVSVDGSVTAARRGIVTLKGSQATITDHLEIDGWVDFSTGHVHFPGSVEVREGIRDKFVVTTLTDLTVHGMAEACSISAGRDCRLTRGMAAKESGMLIVTRDLATRYLNNVCARVGRTLTLEAELMNVQMVVAGRVIGDQAGVAGGTLVAGGAVAIASLGSETGVPTELVLGSLPELERTIAAAKRLFEPLEAQRKKIAAEFAELSKPDAAKSSKSAERLTELQFNQMALEKKLVPLAAKIDRAVEVLEQQTCAQVSIGGCIYPKAVIRIGKWSVDFLEPVRGPVRVVLDAKTDRPVLITFTGEVACDIDRVAKVELAPMDEAMPAWMTKLFAAGKDAGKESCAKDPTSAVGGAIGGGRSAVLVAA